MAQAAFGGGPTQRAVIQLTVIWGQALVVAEAAIAG
jgi:hypothetical protein